MTHKEIEAYILSMPGARLEYPFGEKTAVYKVGEGDEAKMFAIIQEESNPVHLSVKCDPNLALVLREKYETVLPGYHLNKKHWNTIICTGQIEFDELKGFIHLSYRLVTE